VVDLMSVSSARSSKTSAASGFHETLGVVVHEARVAGEILRRRSRDGDGGVVLSGRHDGCEVSGGAVDVAVRGAVKMVASR